MGLSFLNSWLLGALSLVSIPIIIHLLQRRRYRVVRWGAMEFLRLSQQNRSRRLMIEQLILLIIRCLIIALVVLAICRPVARLGGGALAHSRGQVHAVIILDDSYSMGYRPPGEGRDTVLAQAVRRAVELIERGLRRGDAVSVVLASDPARALIRRPSLDLVQAAASVRRLTRPSDAGTHFGKAARLAVEILSESPFLNREVFLVSDNQKIGWEGPAGDPAAWDALARLARIMILPLREGAAPNVAVEWVQAARGVATARTPARIQARIVNTGRLPVRSLLVGLEIDGVPQGSNQHVDVESGQGALVSFTQIFDRPGVRRVTVRTAEDRLPADDRAYLALQVRRSIRVLVLNGKPNPDSPARDAAFFLSIALNPPPDAASPDPTPMDLRVTTPGGFANENVREQDVVIVSDAAALSEVDRRLLAEFIQNGGGLLLFLGPQVNQEVYNRDLFQGSPRLLPARLTGVGSDATALDPASIDHPALQRFRGAQDANLGAAEFRKQFHMEPDPSDRGVRVMARFANGRPAVVERPFGLGRVIAIASTATTEWNDLPLRPVFLPLLHQLVGHLASGQEGTRNGLVGDPLVKPLPLSEAGKVITILGPDGARTDTKATVDERGAIVTMERPALAGFYSLRVPGGEPDTFAINRVARESDLQCATREELGRILPQGKWSWVGPNEDMIAALAQARQGVELWRQLLAAALALMLVEVLLAQWFGRRA